MNCYNTIPKITQHGILICGRHAVFLRGVSLFKANYRGAYIDSVSFKTLPLKGAHRTCPFKDDCLKVSCSARVLS